MRPQNRFTEREDHPKGDEGRPAHRRPPNFTGKGPDGRQNTRVVGQDGSEQHRDGERWPNPSGRNLRSVWQIATEPYPDAHFATFPTALVAPCVKAGTSERGCCPECGAPWVRETGEVAVAPDVSQRSTAHYNTAERYGAGNGGNSGFDALAAKMRTGVGRGTVGWSPSCECKPADLARGLTVIASPAIADAARRPYTPVPCTVLDPFGGSGTVGVVARRLNRSSILIELNEEYAELARKRTAEWWKKATATTRDEQIEGQLTLEDLV